MSESRVVHATSDGWAEVEPRPYKDGTGPFKGVVRHTLLGGRDGEPDLSFQVRYFEVSPGGYSSLERHAHPHAVLVVKGRGKVRLGDRVDSIQPMDVVYVAPGDVHRFEASDEQPLGFVCVVDRERDRPMIVDEPATRAGHERQ
jgi:quercetin dioxygenase-like cupin family protein